MRKILFLIVFSFFISCYSEINSSWLKAYNNISEKQKKELKICLKHLLKNTEFGYVLFGNKPIYFDGFSKDINHVNLDWEETLIRLKFFANFLKKFDLVGIGDDFIVTIQEDKFRTKKSIFSYILVINKKEFVNVVNKNLLLFQYVLGPNVTAEKLLKKIKSPNETIFSAFNNDVTLVGIVLGYGGYNSCFFSYMARISNYLTPNKENLPLISRKILYSSKCLDKKEFFPKYNEKNSSKGIFPSFGYSSLKEEHEDLEKRNISPYKIFKNRKLNFPCFSSELTNETKTIIDEYIQTHNDIQKILSSEDFFEMILAKFIGIDYLDLKPIKNITKNSEVKKEVDYSDLVAQMFLQSFKKYFDNDSLFIQSFIEGLKMKEIKETCKCKLVIDQGKLSRKIKSKKNLDFANDFFEKLKDQKDLNLIIPGKLSYITIRKEKGNALVDFNNVVSVFYKLSRIDKQDFDLENAIGIKIKEPIVNFIPGIAKALIGMKKNERRKVYIHPSYAYGENTTLEPNLGLIAEIELIDFQKNEKNIENKTIIEPHDLEAKDYDLQKLQYEMAKNTKIIGNDMGFSSAKCLKKKPEKVSLEKIIQNLENPNNKIDLENDKMQREISNLYWLIYNN